MAPPAANPFLDLPTARRVAGNGLMLRPAEALQFATLVEAGSDPVLVRGCGSGCGLTHFLAAATTSWPTIRVDGSLNGSWASLRSAVEAPEAVARLVPALLGRWLAAAVRCGDLPSTDPEMVAMQCETEAPRMLDFAAPSPAAKWLLTGHEPVRAVLARHSRLGANGRLLLDAALAWGGRRSAAGDGGWCLPGTNDQEAVLLLATAARLVNLPMLWIFDALDDLALRPAEAASFWTVLSALHASGGRLVLGAQEDIWRTCLEPPLPSAWRRRLVQRSVCLAPLPPSALRDLLDDRLAQAGVTLPGLAAHVVATTFPLGGLPQEALVEAAACWSARHARPLEPVAAPLPSTSEPALKPDELAEALLAAGSSLPFVEAMPLHIEKAGRGVLWQLPGQWVLFVSGDEMDAAAREAVEAQSMVVKATAPPGTKVQMMALGTRHPPAPRWPQPWNAITLSPDESARLARLPVAPAGPPRLALVAGLQPLWERLTRPGHVVA